MAKKQATKYARYELAGGRSDKPDELATLEGKTIEHISYGIDPDKHPKSHGAERLTIYFTDGTEFDIRLGSNAGNIGVDQPKLFVDMMFFIYASADARRKAHQVPKA